MGSLLIGLCICAMHFYTCLLNQATLTLKKKGHCKERPPLSALCTRGYQLVHLPAQVYKAHMLWFSWQYSIFFCGSWQYTKGSIIQVPPETEPAPKNGVGSLLRSMITHSNLLPPRPSLFLCTFCFVVTTCVPEDSMNSRSSVWSWLVEMNKLPAVPSCYLTADVTIYVWWLVAVQDHHRES
jgi:hypothetical protein